MPVLGEAAINLTGNLRPLSGSLGRVRGLLTGLGGHVARLGGVISAALGGIGVGASLKLAAEFEQAEISLTTLLGSAEKARRMLGELKDFAARTPFEFRGLLDSSRLMLAMGFQADRLLPMMEAIGDATAALGGNRDIMDGLVRALGQMRAKGVVSAEEMMQLAERGIPAWEILASRIGVSIPEAMKLAEKRAIDAGTAIDALLAGLNERFGGAMEQQSRTLAGRFSTLKDNVTITLREIGTTIAEELDLTDVIERISQKLQELGPRIREVTTQMAQAAREVAKWVIENRQAVLNTAKWTAGLAAATFVLPRVIGGVTLLTKAVRGLAEAYKTLAAIELTSDLAGVFSGLGAGRMGRIAQRGGAMMALTSLIPRGFRRNLASVGAELKNIFRILGTRVRNVFFFDRRKAIMFAKDMGELRVALGLAKDGSLALGPALGKLVTAFKTLLAPVVAVAGALAQAGIIATAVGAFVAAGVQVAVFGKSWSDASLAVAEFLAKVTGLRAAMEWIGLIDKNVRKLAEAEKAAAENSKKLTENAQALQDADSTEARTEALEARVDLLKERLALEAQLAVLRGPEPGRNFTPSVMVDAWQQEIRKTEAMLASLQQRDPTASMADGAAKLSGEWRDTGEAIQDAAAALEQFTTQFQDFTDTDFEKQIRTILDQQQELLKGIHSQAEGMDAVPGALFLGERQMDVMAASGRKLAEVLGEVRQRFTEALGNDFAVQLGRVRDQIGGLIQDIRTLAREKLIDPAQADRMLRALQEKLRNAPRDLADRVFRDFTETDQQRQLREIEARAQAAIQAIRQAGFSPEEEARKTQEITEAAQRQSREATGEEERDSRTAQLIGLQDMFNRIQGAVASAGHDPGLETAKNTKKTADEAKTQTRIGQSSQALLEQAVALLQQVAKNMTPAGYAP